MQYTGAPITYNKPGSLTCPVKSTDTLENFPMKNSTYLLLVISVGVRGIELASPASAVECFMATILSTTSNYVLFICELCLVAIILWSIIGVLASYIIVIILDAIVLICISLFIFPKCGERNIIVICCTIILCLLDEINWRVV